MSELIFKNGTILTLNSQKGDPSVCEAILVKNGYIFAVGTLAEIEKKATKNAEVIGLNGQTLMPAFNDAHIHIWKVGDLLTFMLDLRGVQSLAEMQAKIADFAAKNPKNAWILARGFNEANFSDGEMPTRFDLDKVVSDRPCYVIRTCAHVAVLNSKALEICGINEETIVPFGGEIRQFKEAFEVRNLKFEGVDNLAFNDELNTQLNSDFDSELINKSIAKNPLKTSKSNPQNPSISDPSNFKPQTSNYENLTGVLTETALGLVQKFLPKYTPKALKIMVLAAQEALLKCGITAATDPAVMPDLLAVYKEMDAQNELKIRINAIPIVVPDGATEALPLTTLYESNFLKINTVKFFADGGLSGKTAALKKPYKNTNEHGVLRLNFDFFMPLAAKAQAAGFKIATHAIGDTAIDEVLKVYKFIAKNNKKQLKHRIEHLGIPSKNNLKLMQKLGVHCVSQPIFIYELGQNFRNYLTPQYLNKVYPYRTILDAKVNLAFSSDAPVVKNFNPLMGIQNAVQRIDSQGFTIGEAECITVEEALVAYTLNAAKANDDAAIMGSIEVGKRADFVILDKNPIYTEGSLISEINVKNVYVLGIAQL
jgi:predicted amidohydrolase YtcJ